MGWDRQRQRRSDSDAATLSCSTEGAVSIGTLCQSVTWTLKDKIGFSSV